ESDAPPVSADRLIRRLSGRYFLVMLAVAALVIADQAIVQPLLARMNSYAPAINLAGRQRMLRQQLTKAALAPQGASGEASRERYREELRTTLAQWSAAQSALREGDSQLDLPKLDSSQFNAAWIELEPHFAAMVAAASELASQTNLPGSDTAGTVSII